MDRVTEGLAQLRRRRWTCVIGFALLMPLTIVVGTVFGSSLGVATFVLGATLLLATALSLYWTRCPRCGDHFFTGVLHSSSPELGGQVLWRSSCVNCRLSLKAKDGALL